MAPYFFAWQMNSMILLPHEIAFCRQIIKFYASNLNDVTVYNSDVLLYK
jgi:hypothetical protein